MISLLVFLIALYQFQRPVYSEIAGTSRLNLNALTIQDVPNSIASPELLNDSETDSREMPFVKNGPDQTEIQFRRPISAVNIDYSKNAIILKFRQHQFLDQDELERRKAFEANFMRFGKRSLEQAPTKNNIDRYERSSEGFDDVEKVGLRDSRGDNFMRFGRDSKHDTMRFGRNPAKDFMRLGRSPPKNFMRLGRNSGKDYMRFGRSNGEDYMRLGRSPAKDFMRLGRSPAKDFMRLGRSPGKDYMRFGRSPGEDFMRFGRNTGEDYMRLGRSSGEDYMRLGRNPAKDFMRLGRSPGEDYMRFGRSPKEDFMRLGRDSAKEFMRFGRSNAKDKDSMRFGRSDPNSNAEKSANFMRFGRINEISGQSIEKNSDKETNHTTPRLLHKNDIKEAAKLLRETDASNEESNPMDKAIEVLFNSQDNEQTEQHKNSEEDSSQEMEY